VGTLAGVSGWVIPKASSTCRNMSGLNVKCLLLMSNFNHKWNVLTNFSRTSNIKFHSSP
jgi:hypothetical protein